MYVATLQVKPILKLMHLAKTFLQIGLLQKSKHQSMCFHGANTLAKLFFKVC